jgi:hypothetical protein
VNYKLNAKLKLLGLFAVSLALQTAANADYTPTYLPQSSIWEGSRIYNQNGVYAYVEYAVYDTWLSNYQNVFDKAVKDSFPNPGSGEYVYAYEILNLGTDFDPIATFKLLSGNPSDATGIGALRDNSGTDIVPTNDGSSFVWTFENGVFVANKHSAFMVFSSNQGPVAGSFEISTLGDNGNEPPNPNTPEPATIALVGCGAIGLLIKRRRNQQNRTEH